MFVDHKISIINITILCVMITFCNSYDIFSIICVLMYLICLEILYHKFSNHLLHIKPTVTLNSLLRCNHERLCTFTLVWVVCHVHLSCSSYYETLIILFFVFSSFNFYFNGMCLYAVKLFFRKEEPTSAVYNEPCHCLTNIEEAKKKCNKALCIL